MKKLLIPIICTLLLVFSLSSLSAFAHSGGTDSRGGHYDHSTGDYHFHHGYPEHEHINGKCPYSSNSSSNYSSSNSKDNDLSVGAIILIIAASLYIIWFIIYLINIKQHPSSDDDKTSPGCSILFVACILLILICIFS